MKKYIYIRRNCPCAQAHTGNTFSVAERIREEFLAAGHFVNLERVTALNENPSASVNIQLQSIPITNEYDVLIFGAPTRVFSLSPVMKAYLAQISSLQSKRVGCFVTQILPYPWMGGNRTIEQMKKACEDKEVTVLETGIVNWSHRKRERTITDVLARLSKLGV